MTLRLNVQEPFAGSVAPDRETAVAPAVAVMAPPPQEPFWFAGVAIVSPVGRASVKPTPVSGIVFTAGFANVKLSVVVPFRGMVAAPNDFVMVGGAMTVRLADDVEPVPPSVDVTAPVVLFCGPGTVPFTLTLNVQDAPPARAALLRLILLDPAAAVIVPPPHVPFNPFGAATCKPSGRLSVNPMAVKV